MALQKEKSWCRKKGSICILAPLSNWPFIFDWTKSSQFWSSKVVRAIVPIWNTYQMLKRKWPSPFSEFWTILYRFFLFCVSQNHLSSFMRRMEASWNWVSRQARCLPFYCPWFSYYPHRSHWNYCHAMIQGNILQAIIYARSKTIMTKTKCQESYLWYCIQFWTYLISLKWMKSILWLPYTYRSVLDGLIRGYFIVMKLCKKLIRCDSTYDF